MSGVGDGPLAALPAFVPEMAFVPDLLVAIAPIRFVPPLVESERATALEPVLGPALVIEIEFVSALVTAASLSLFLSLPVFAVGRFVPDLLALVRPIEFASPL